LVRFSVYHDKTELILTRRRKHSGLFEPHFFGVPLSHSMSVKDLGVVLHSQLTWREHVDAKLRKAHNLLWACWRACGTMWGQRPKVVHWLHIAIIWPSITFASRVWWPGCHDILCQEIVSRVHELDYVGITGVIRTTPTGAMEALTGLPSLDLVIQGEVRSPALCPWCLGCRSYLHSS